MSKVTSVIIAVLGIIVFSSSVSFACINHSPVAILSAQSVGDSVTLDGSASYDPDDNDSIVKYEWDFDYTTGNFNPDYTETPPEPYSCGDPNNAPDGTPDGITRHSYSTPGTYTVALRVTDNHGATNTDSCIVYVGQTYYVDPNGNDANDGLSWPTAFKTIQKGMNTAINGDAIDVNEGVYYEQINFNGKAITLRSTNSDDWNVVSNTIIDVSNGWFGVAFCTSEGPDSVLKGLTVQHATNGILCGNPYNPVPANPTIERCIIKDNVDGVWIHYNYGVSPVLKGNIISNNSGAGIFVGSASVVAQSNLIYSNTTGIDGSYSSNSIIQNNTIVNNISCGIAFELGNAEITNCILWNNNDDLSGCTATYSCIEDNDSGEGNIHDDPCFVDDVNNNYHIGATSPCINAGDPNGDYNGQTDIDNQPRVINDRVDIGAYEALPTISASAGANGTISPSGAVTVNYNGCQLFTATSNTGYTVDTWSVDSSVVQTGGNTYTISNITADHTVAVTFKIQTFTINASAGANGTVEPTSAVVNYGDGQLFTATPNTGYAVDKWYVDGGEVQTGGATYTLTNITASHAVSVTFKFTNVICVDKNMSGGRNNGTSWADAFTNIASAISAASAGNEIWVAEGIYTLTSQLNVNKTVKIYGGFNGTEDHLSERNWNTNITKIDGQNNVRCINITANCTIDGFTITKGKDPVGAGICCSGASPLIENCTVSNNTALGVGNGGGMRNYQSSPTIVNCTFSNNYSNEMGGGIFNWQCSSSTTIDNCTFTENSAKYGGGIYNLSSYAFITNCVFFNNSALGTYGDGGAILNQNYHTHITNCTIYNNTAGRYTGGLFDYSSEVANCIFWGNTDSSGSGESAQIRGASSGLNYNCIQGWTGSLGGTGNIGDNPNFIDGLHLGNDSRCIDAGDNTKISEPYDIAGNARKIDDPGQYNYGNGTPPIVDMGAYERTTPTVLNYIKVAGGRFHTMAIEYNNRLWGCGSNNGYIGDGTYTNRMTFVPTHDGDMGTLSGYLENIIDVDAGESFTLAVDSSKNVWSTGRNDSGQLGHTGAGVGVYTPVHVNDGEMNTASGFLENIVMVSASIGNNVYAYSLAIDSTGKVWAWGSDIYGELGNGGVWSEGPIWPVQETPIQVHAGEQNPTHPDYPLQGIVDIEAGGYHTIACDSSGHVWTWGKNDDGQLGNGEESSYENKPVHVLDGQMNTSSGFLENIVSVASSKSGTSFAVDSAGHVWGWGSGSNGILNGGYSSTTPVQIVDGDQTPGTSNYLENIVAVSAGAEFILALENNGNVWAWGYEGHGALGLGAGIIGSNTPKRVRDSAGTGYLTNIVHIDAGFYHSTAIDSSGNIWVWGQNYYWPLGLNSTQNKFTPQLVTLR